MSKARFALADGCVVRGMMIRLYPTTAEIETLTRLEDEQRYVWNWLVGRVETFLEANDAYARRLGLVDAPPAFPDYEGMTPEQASNTKAAYRAACAARKKRVFEITRKLSECALPRFSDMLAHFQCRHDYQLFRKAIGWRFDNALSGAHTLQALGKNYLKKIPGQRRKRFRSRTDPMPLQTRSGVCFELGVFGARGKNATFYDCRVSFNGLKIRGRLPGRAPTGRVLEGVSIVKKADGWWASIKQEIPAPALPAPVAGSVVGIDVGLDLLAATSDGRKIPNARGRELSEMIAGRQALKLPVGRLHLRAARHTRHQIFSRLVPHLAAVETIKVEKLPANIGQNGSRKVSYMRTIKSLLTERYGDRVREVEPAFTSQTCSQCGERCKTAWAYERGRRGKCPACGYEEDRDVNAARNIAAKPPIALEL